MTRKKLARSSGCIVEYVGYTVFMSGSKAERDRAQEYLGWLFEQLKGPVYVDGWEERDDVTMVDVPRDCVGYVTGARRATHQTRLTPVLRDCGGTSEADVSVDNRDILRREVHRIRPRVRC